MQDIHLPVRPIQTSFTDNDFTFPATSIMIRIGAISDDMSSVQVYAETTGEAPFAAPVTLKLNMTYTYLVLPWDFIKAAKAADGVKFTETNNILAGFKLAIDLATYQQNPTLWTALELPQ